MGKVRLTTEVLIWRNLAYPHTNAPAQNSTRNRSYISLTPCRLDYTVMGVLQYNLERFREAIS